MIENYLQQISEEHYKKLEKIAEHHGVSIEEVMENIVEFAKKNIAAKPEYSKDLWMVKEIEDTIDIISNK